MQKLGYSEEDGVVCVRMTSEDWNRLLLNLGFAAGAMMTTQGRHGVLALANRLNVGNPRFTPYEIPPTLPVKSPSTDPAQ